MPNRNFTLTDDQLAALRAGWQYFMEADDNLDVMAEALEIDPAERGMDENNEYKEGHDESTDPAAKLVGEVNILIMTD
jgi:hypothetical protein